MSHAAVIVTLADEVTDALNQKKGSWAANFTAKRVDFGDKDLEQINVLAVQVWPVGCRMVPSSRAHWQHEYDIDIALHFKPDPTASPQAQFKTDNLQLLVQQMADYFKTVRMTHSNCVLTAAAIGLAGSETPYSHEAIISTAFISGVRLTFRTWR